MKRPIYIYSNNGASRRRMCDVIVEGDKVELEFKHDKQYDRISWSDMVHQVQAATGDTNNNI